MTFLFLLSLAITSYAQYSKKDAEVLLKEENYPLALKVFEKIYEKDSLDPDMNYKIGICYLNCNANPKLALPHLLKAKNSKKDDDYIYLYELAWAYLNNEKFDEALENLEKSKNLAVKNKDFLELIELLETHTKNAKKYYKNPLNISFVNMGKYINSEMDEITPVITADGEFLFFTSNKKFDRTFNVNTYDVLYVQFSKGSFGKPRSLTVANTPEDEFIAGVSAKGDEIFVQQQNYEAFEDLAMIPRTERGFGKKELLQGNVQSKQAEYAASTSITGDTLFFSSDRNGGQGGLDIFMSRRLPNGEWADAKNLGNVINSKFDEDFPMMSPDGKTLYFCSNNEKSMGGFDVFKTQILPNGEWTEPQNIGYPLNDVFNNKTIAFSPNQRYAYISKNRPDTYGYNDLYQVIFNDKDPSVKILILKMKTGNKEQSVDFAKTDTTIHIIAKKNKTTFGKYAYHSPNSQTTIALPPGTYSIEIEGKKTQKYTFKIKINDAPEENKIIKQSVFLKPKK